VAEQAPTLVATLLLAAVFLNPYPRHVLDERTHGFRSFVSFAAGLSVAYVFIDLLPELAEAAEEFGTEAGDRGIPLAEYAVHAAALLGFVLFYGLERLVRWSRERPAAEAREDQERVEALLKLGGSGAYVALVTYLIRERFGADDDERLILYFVAMAFHFVALRHSLRFEYPDRFDGGWRWGLAAACLLGWLAGTVIGVPPRVVALLLGFLGGMVIMNTTVMELPSEKEGRFTPFVLGSLLYAIFLAIA
jgi:zinc transporter ZupT